jgi:glyoxylase-like metal-dependent hydrolase (beta-lactamase superfamily II)
MYGFQGGPQPAPSSFLKEGHAVVFGNSTLHILFTPGHSPGSVCFYSEADKFVIGGDVLFQNSIGRTDLPGGDYATLEKSIKTQLYTLPDDVTVYPGHGPETTIGHEKQHNAFVTA